MKGIHKFESQAEGLKYITGLIVDAANRGVFETDGIKTLFHDELRKWDRNDNHCIGSFWGMKCLPILTFFRSIVESGDNSMSCDFGWDIKLPSERWTKELEYSNPIIGEIFWRGICTPGRFARVSFEADGSAVLEYCTATGKPSSFLGFPEIEER